MFHLPFRLIQPFFPHPPLSRQSFTNDKADPLAMGIGEHAAVLIPPSDTTRFTLSDISYPAFAKAQDVNLQGIHPRIINRESLR